MRRIIKNILQIFIKVMLVIAIVICSYGVLKQVFKNTDVSTNESFKALPENSLDVIVLGSSQAQYSFSPSLFYKDTGLYSYNLGSQCQQPEISYQMLKEALKTQSPKLVILEVFTFMPLRSICKEDSCYVVAAYQMTGQERLDTLAYISEEKAQQYYSDFTSLHNNWRNYEKDEIVDRVKNAFKKEEEIEYNDSDFGYVYMDGILDDSNINSWFPSTFNELEEVELESIHLEALENIYNLCQENGIELMLYKTPMDSIDITNYSYLLKVWEWAKDHDVDYYDILSKASQLLLRINIHSDSFHSNVDGAGIITNYLANKINNSGKQFNHIENEELSKIYDIGANNVLKMFITYERDPRLYLPLFNSSNGYVVIRYNPSSKKIDSDLYNSLVNVGIGDFDPNVPFVAIIHNGELLEKSWHSIDESIYDKNLYVSIDEAYYGDECINSNSKVDFIYICDNGEFLITKSIDNKNLY